MYFPMNEQHYAAMEELSIAMFELTRDNAYDTLDEKLSML